MKGLTGSTGVAVLFFNLSARLGVGGQRHVPAALIPGMSLFPLPPGESPIAVK